MRVGISGAQGVGKTTLFRALRDTGILPDHVWIESPIRSLKDMYGLTLNEDSNSLTQVMIMNHFALNAVMYENLVTDRSPLDSLAYTRILYEQDKVSPLVYARIYEVFVHSQPLYDLTFLLSPEFPIVEDGVRSVDHLYQGEISQCCEMFAERIGLQHIRLTGSVQCRVDTALGTIAQYVGNRSTQGIMRRDLLKSHTME